MSIKSLLCLTVLSFSSLSFGSDHIDGVPSLELHEQVDLTDLYAFRSDDNTNLTVMLNLYPGVADDGHFSSKVSYDIILNELNLAEAPLMQTFVNTKASDLVVTCSFTDPSHHNSHNHKASVTCEVTNRGEAVDSVHALVGEIKSNTEKSMKIYTGPRSDAFFITRSHFDSVTQRKGFTASAHKAESNLMERINVLSIALEFNLDKFTELGSSSYVGVSAESFTTYEGYKRILDRVGRPEITNLTLHDITDGNVRPVKRKYNQMSLSDVKTSEHFKTFKNRLNSNIGAYDLLDGNADWSTEALNVFTDVLMDDQLVVSLASDCRNSSNSYLEIERDLLRGFSYKSCGGRQITDNIMTRLYSMYIGGTEALLSDYRIGVSVPYQSSSKVLDASFPYLVEPESTGWGTINLTRALLNTYIKKNQAE